MNDPSAPKGAKEDVKTRESHAYCNLKTCAAYLMLLAPFPFLYIWILNIGYGYPNLIWLAEATKRVDRVRCDGEL